MLGGYYNTMSDIIDIGPRKWWAAAAMCLAGIAFSLDLTVLNLALPTLSTSLHASTGQLQWIADAYALVLAVLTLPAGMLGDRFGRKRLLLIALAVFGIASAFCAYSTSVNMLITGRLLLGVGAAFILPLTMSVMPIYFKPEERTKALAILMGGIFLAYPLGPILGGWLLTHFWWGSVFLINVPVVIIAIATIGAILPESKSSKKHSIDIMGILLSSLALTGITYGAIEAESHGWSDHGVLASIIIGIILLPAFFYWERSVVRRKQDPLIDIKLFESRAFTWGTILMTTVNFSLFGLLFGLPQYLEAVRGYKPLTAGYYLLPMIVGLMIGSITSAKAGKKLDARTAVAIGYALMAIGLLLGTRTTLHVGGSFIVVWTGVIGLGLGVAMPNVANSAISALTAEHSAAGTALISAVRQVGGTLGIALLGTVLGASYRSQLHSLALPSALTSVVRSSVTAGTIVASKIHDTLLLHIVRLAFVHGMAVMLLICGCIALGAMLLALLFLPRSHTAAPKVKQ
jgi:DHA2 family multidrug resistance protein-like MFS transporter